VIFVVEKERFMLKKVFRWPTVFILAVLVIASLIPTMSFLLHTKASVAHAAGTPTITFSATVVKPYQQVTATAQGFAPQDTVSLRLDTTNNYVFAYFYCDMTGTCTATINMPFGSVTEGQHTIIATGSSGLVAQTTVTFVPKITLYGPNQTPKGGPGTNIQVYGAAFNANENVQIYWGDTGSGGILEGNITTDNTGTLNFSFNGPTGVVPGHYRVIALRSKQKPAMVSGLFTVLTPLLGVTPPSIRSGQYINLYVVGFQTNEQVTVSWNANGGQQLATFNTDNVGSGGTNFNPPEAPKGSYTITVTGNASGIQMNDTIAVGPGIALNPPNDMLPGSTITVIGGGFTPGETVNVHLKGMAKFEVSGTTDSSGAFSLPLTLPTTYNTASNYFYVIASNAAGTEQAKTTFQFEPVWVGPESNSWTYGMPYTFVGQGFVPGETIKLYWNYQLPGQLLAGATTAATDGTFNMTLNAPSDPNLGNVPYAAIGSISKLEYVSQIIEYPGLVLSPPSGNPGDILKIDGGGFDGNETVTVSFNGTNIADVNTDASGAFHVNYVLPKFTGPGNVTIKAIGNTSNINLSSNFGYIPTMSMTPTKGPSGTILTVTGLHFSAQWNIGLYWFDPMTDARTYLQSGYADINGSFITTVTIPSKLVGGNTYYLQADDTFTNIVTQLPFKALVSCKQCLTASPNIAIPGTTVNVQGSNFNAGETVNIYFQSPSNGQISAIVGSDGTFTASLTVPRTYKRGISYYIYAVSTTGKDKASAQFLFVQPQVWVADPYGGNYYGQMSGFGGSGFAPGEPVDFYWNYAPGNNVKGGTTLAAADGSIDVSLKMPSIPFDSQINSSRGTLIARGRTSGAQATTFVYELADFSINPTNVHPGSQVHINAGGFGSNEQVTISINGTPMSTTTADVYGAFNYVFTIPSTTAIGSIDSIDLLGISGARASSYVIIEPTFSITPITGSSGSSITVEGNYFTASGNAQVFWYDSTTYQQTLLATVVISSAGVVKTTITAPAGLISGTIYEVQIVDESTSVSVQASFIAQ
jgi:hypothetical protein